MPRRLPGRWQPESIREFRASAQQRYEDGLAVVAGGRRTGAIYLWGYRVEMTLKSAYFSLIGLAPDAIHTWSGHIRPAINHGRTVLHIFWPPGGEGHNARAWADLLVLERAARGVAYPVAFGLEVQNRGQAVGQLWSETLRYHKNVAYSYEVRQVREAAEWFLLNTPIL